MEQTAPTMPPEIAKAVVKVMSEVKKLGKDARNEHGKYQYVSVDQFFQQVGKLMAEAGIFVIVNEAQSEIETRETTDTYGKLKMSAWLSTAYDIFIGHESGVMYGPLRRHQQVSATGPQSYGASEAYVEKYFLRNLFKIPTGEADADADAQDGLPATKRAPTPPKPPVIPGEMFDTETSQITRDVLIEAITMANTLDELSAWFELEKHKIKKLREADKQAVMAELDSTEQSLKGKAKAA
jgi:hypothetical protein